MSNFLWRFANKVVLEARMTSSSRHGVVVRPSLVTADQTAFVDLPGIVTISYRDVSHVRFSEPPMQVCRTLVSGLRHQLTCV